MSRLTIGRAGYDPPLPNVATFEAAGDRLRISGRLLSRTLHSAQAVTDAKLLRQQLLGYDANPDEAIIPITYDKDPTVDGFYRVNAVDVDVEPGGLVKIGAFPYRAELERVPGYASPLFESIVLGALRTNGHSIVTGTSIPWHGIPDATSFYDVGVALSAAVSRTASDGTVQIQQGGGNALYNAKARWRVPPASFYTSGALIEVGTTLRTVVGRQIENLPTDWRISNGLVRVTPVAGGSKLDISCFDGTQFDTAKRFWVGSKIGAFLTQFGTWTTISVVRNSPEAVTIRLTAPPTVGTRDGQYTVDLTLRRGARVVEIVIASRIAFNGGVKLDTIEAATALTGGIRATSNDAAGNRYILTSPLAFTSDTTNGSIYSTATATAVPLAVGLEVSGSSAAGLEAAQSLIYQYMAAVTARLVVVGT